MATYQFSSITSPEAQNYSAANDDLLFNGVTGATATNIEVVGTFTIRIISTGSSVTLGSGAAGELLTLPDGSRLRLARDTDDVISGGAGGDRLYGGGGRDALNGLAGADILDGGVLEDTLNGGAGADTLTGGGDIDAFVFAPGDSGVTDGQIDVISDWTPGFEKIVFSTPMTGGDYVELTASSYAEALNAANQQIASGAMDVVAVRVGSDVFVFADTRNDNGTADDAIRLANKNLDMIASSNVTGFTPPASGGGGTGGGATGTPSTGTITFETVAADVALGYSAAANDLRFSNITVNPTNIFVGFFDDGRVRIVSGGPSGNLERIFGAGLQGETNLIFTNNARAVIGTTGGDVLAGATTDDSIWGGPGNDTLMGGTGDDLLYGGDGADLFVVWGRQGTAAFTAAVDTIADWQVFDRITFGTSLAGSTTNYVELDAGGLTEATSRITSGAADIVAYAITDAAGPAVVVVADPFGRNVVDARVTLRGASLSQVDFAHVLASPTIAFASLDPVPAKAITAAPGPVTTVGGDFRYGAYGSVKGVMDRIHMSDLQGGRVVDASGSHFYAQGDTLRVEFFGRDFTYDVRNNTLFGMLSGTLNRFDADITPDLGFFLRGIQVSAITAFDWIFDDATTQAFTTLFAGSDDVVGFTGSDLIRGFAGDDTLGGFGGYDELYGGAGNDVLYAIARPGRVDFTFDPPTTTYMRGEEGDDNIYGGSGFDDINGNMGNDTAGGGPGNDWVVGGKDNDLLFGDAGNDLVYGNLGNDTCEGGDGADIVRGGQDNDIVRGGAGDDFVSGDKGDDTMAGGDGADSFHTFGDAGIDRVTDFNRAQGDRVQLDPGTQYTVTQVGADTIIDMVGGGKMILVGVQMSTLTPGWIFGA